MAASGAVATADTVLYDKTYEDWTERVKVFDLLGHGARPPARQVNPSDSFEEQLAGGQPMLLRPVYKVSPLTETELSFTKPAATFVKKPTRVPKCGLAKQNLAYSKVPAPPQKSESPSFPVPIPGALNDSPLERRTSLIKAIPPPTIRPADKLERKPESLDTSPWKSVATHSPPQAESWMQRQMRFPLDRPAQQPAGLNPVLKARDAAVKARAAKQSSAVVKTTSPQELAWRLRFKKKWIREELFARRLEFPEDPDYEDDWAAAQDLVEACGPKLAMQAALLESPIISSPGDDDSSDCEDADVLLMDDNQEPQNGHLKCMAFDKAKGSDIAGKVTTLVRLQQRAQA